MQLFVRGSSNYSLEVSSLPELFQKISSAEASDEVCVFANGQPLNTESNFAALENVTLDVTVPLKGGKVHGSLARAGKVRGQTPKVEPQEKKKKKTGRAKKRMLYNKRFVNVDATSGRKKGPNANS
jgi:small subunit ribosomal protein S30e